jgi:hypothetical protein
MNANRTSGKYQKPQTNLGFTFVYINSTHIQSKLAAFCAEPSNATKDTRLFDVNSLCGMVATMRTFLTSLFAFHLFHLASTSPWRCI